MPEDHDVHGVIIKMEDNTNVITCGICGEKFKKIDVIKDDGSETGYLCYECAEYVHREYLIDEY